MAKHDFKKIRVWKVFVLSVITLGVYAIIWLVKRNNELPGDKPKFTHWGWLAGMLAVICAALVTLYIYTLAAIADSSTAAAVNVYTSLALVIAADVVITVWVVRAVQRLNSAVAVPLSRANIILLAFFFAPTLIAIEQSAINNATAAKKHRDELESKYQIATSVSLALGILLVIAPFVMTPIDQQLREFERDHAEIRRLVGETVELTKEYVSCMTEVSEKYPDQQAIDDNAEAYKAATEKCDEIYQKIENIK